MHKKLACVTLLCLPLCAQERNTHTVRSYKKVIKSDDNPQDATAEIDALEQESLASSSNNQSLLTTIITTLLDMIQNISTITSENDTTKINTSIANLLAGTINMALESAKNDGLPDNASIDELIAHFKLEDKVTATLLTKRMHELEETTKLQPQPHPTLHTNGDGHVSFDELLSAFTHIVGNITAIAADPNNPAVIGSNVGQILASIIDIAMEAIREETPIDQKALEDLLKHLRREIETQQRLSTTKHRSNDEETITLTPEQLKLLIQEVVASQPQQQHVTRPQQHAHVTTDDLPDSGQIILASFADVIGHFGTIVSDPHNPQAVGAGLTGMIGSIINGACLALQSKSINSTSQPKDIIAALNLNKELGDIVVAVASTSSCKEVLSNT